MALLIDQVLDSRINGCISRHLCEVIYNNYLINAQWLIRRQQSMLNMKCHTTLTTAPFDLITMHALCNYWMIPVLSLPLSTLDSSSMTGNCCSDLNWWLMKQKKVLKMLLQEDPFLHYYLFPPSQTYQQDLENHHFQIQVGIDQKVNRDKDLAFLDHHQIHLEVQKEGEESREFLQLQFALGSGPWVHRYECECAAAKPMRLRTSYGRLGIDETSSWVAWLYEHPCVF